MTVIGKILTILVFFLSLVFMGFAITINRLNKDPQSGKNWYDVAELRRKEVESAYKDVEAKNADLLDREAKINELASALETEKGNRKKDVEAAKNAEKLAVQEAANISRQFENAQNLAKRHQEELLLRQKDVLSLRDDLQKREAEIADVRADITRARNQAIQSDVAAKSFKDRLEQLERTYQELVRTVETRDAVAAGPKGKAEERLTLKPPAEEVKGLVRGVSGDGNLIEITIGSDDGIGLNNTLEVYRLQPKPEYLGVIRIIDVRPDRAVGKVETKQYRGKIKANDVVSSKI